MKPFLLDLTTGNVFAGMLFTVLALIGVVALTVLWSTARRALAALESIASSLAEVVKQREGEEAGLRRQNALRHKLYRQFIAEDESREYLPPRERHEAFRVWSETRRPGEKEEAA